jgi:hypothetical protein
MCIQSPLNEPWRTDARSSAHVAWPGALSNMPVNFPVRFALTWAVSDHLALALTTASCLLYFETR